ncbi:MAG: hypothetical protein CBHOC_3980 [uncultured Caballeronia sp.]|nr:MAG: hypothetical protein CBHOC_3980 [uncultured Caballeronia sp.]
MFAGILVLTAFALVPDGLVALVERRLMKWQPRSGETGKALACHARVASYRPAYAIRNGRASGATKRVTLVRAIRLCSPGLSRRRNCVHRASCCKSPPDFPCLESRHGADESGS